MISITAESAKTHDYQWTNIWSFHGASTADAIKFSHNDSHDMLFAYNYPDSKVHVTNMGPTWVLPAPGGPHVSPMDLAIRVSGHGPRSVFYVLFDVAVNATHSGLFIKTVSTLLIHYSHEDIQHMICRVLWKINLITTPFIRNLPYMHGIYDQYIFITLAYHLFSNSFVVHCCSGNIQGRGNQNKSSHTRHMWASTLKWINFNDSMDK